MNIVIFGAQGYALGAGEAVKTLYPKHAVKCFLVSSLGDNAATLGGIPVKDISTLSKELSAKEKRNVLVLIATPEDVQPEIEEILENFGFINYRRLDSKSWSDLVKMFHFKQGDLMPLSVLLAGDSRPFIRMYMAKSHRDISLGRGCELPEYVLPIQVGAANCDIRLSGLCDNTGENISKKNVNYSELSGLYWIWKNRLCSAGAKEGCRVQYYGLAQYRRMLFLSDDDILRLVDNDVDVVLPYPLPYEPGIDSHHRRYLNEADWQVLLRTLGELEPDYADCFPQVLEQRYLYNYNVILAKKNVLKDYCDWLFPILERVEEMTEPKGSMRADRYIGYMGETLETLYFMKNKHRLNIVHTECRLYT